MAKRLTQNVTSLYIEAANSLRPKTARKRIVAYVESYDDVSFWSHLLSEYNCDKYCFQVMLPSNTSLAKGKKVSIVLGFNAECEVLLREDFRALGIEPLISTMDGSCGTRGFVTDAIREHKPEFDYFYTCGPMPMMKALCQMLDCKGEVSLEERMGCGVGYCYGCSCKTSVGTKRICKDGPVFKKEEVLW